MECTISHDSQRCYETIIEDLHLAMHRNVFIYTAESKDNKNVTKHTAYIVQLLNVFVLLFTWKTCPAFLEVVIL